MHQIIYALVEASTQEEALAKAKTSFSRLVGVGPEAGGVFDYYVTFDDDTSMVAGKARWGELPVVALLESQEGAELLKRGWNATKEEFKENLEQVQEAAEEFSIEEFMHDKNLARHACHCLGAYSGPSIYLYDEFGDGIRNREHLDHVLNKEGTLWIISADVHY
ncbi:hypothetical protein [Halorussus salinisoli]|uniref:hypothetical protein n=1 Tax=Halorussus salinisoli TaxID=2558242 RepID=UPI0010C18D7B|nr:hypothetical protein [Halorussus salinisoli]